MMTRKDYVATAEVLNKVFTQYQMQEFGPALVEKMINEFSEMFVKDNSNFDKTKFENAVMK